MAPESSVNILSSVTKPRKRFVGSKSAKPSRPGAQAPVTNQLPDDILSDAQLNAAIELLPKNYSFEIHKTIHHVRKNKATMVALQMPEGLQMFACTIADIIEQFTEALTVIMGDVTYGACCIDDYTAAALGCDMIVHYGHSCLVPIDQTTIKTLYVFVEIAIDIEHLTKTMRTNFPDDRQTFHKLLLVDEDARSKIPIGSQIGPNRRLLVKDNEYPIDIAAEDTLEPSDNTRQPTRLALVSTIQFVAALQHLKDDLCKESLHDESLGKLAGLIHLTSNQTESIIAQRTSSPYNMWAGKYDAMIPRSKPLSPGEILGCTAPRLSDVDALLYLGDGRFHLESIMIANPSVPAFRYDPYTKKLTRERYGHRQMQAMRDDAVQMARKDLLALKAPAATPDAASGPLWGVVLGTLGRQGNFKQLQAITRQLEAANVAVPYVQILLSEISPAKLALFNPHISIFVQTSCPRLSIDWGYAFERPLLSPYETAVAIGATTSWQKDPADKVDVYPMDFYEAGTPWAISRTRATF